MKFYIRCSVFILIAFFSSVCSAKVLTKDNLIIPSTFRFAESLVYRSEFRPDVRYLQNLLNMNTETQIQVTLRDNSGSNRNLTDTFGSRTRNALSRFHTVYAKEIADEYKLINPNATSTTFVPNSEILDFYTRGVMNKMIIKYTSADNATTTNSTNSDSSAAGIVAAAAAASGGSFSSQAAATSLIPFGGQSVSMMVCTCSANMLLYVRDPRGYTVPLIYQPGVTVLYRMGNPTVGVNLLGRYVTGGICLIYVGTGCSSGGTPVGTMVQVGTSLTI